MLFLSNLIRSDQKKVDTDCETCVSEWTIYVNILENVQYFLVFVVLYIVLKREKDIQGRFIGIAEGTFLCSSRSQ